MSYRKPAILDTTPTTPFVVEGMADSGLDNFFAKKDKGKKGKTKTKFTTTNTVAKNLEEGDKKPEVPVKKDVKEKISILSTKNAPCAQVSSQQDDDEWKLAEDESECDYSGLKLQALSICEKDDERSKEQSIDDNGDVCNTAGGLSGPWKFQAPPPSVYTGEVEVQEERPVRPSTYKPPALRKAPVPSSSSTRKNPKFAPRITSEVHFPSLASPAAEGASGETDKYFQSVRHGARSVNDTQQELKLDLENKFSALQ